MAQHLVDGRHCEQIAAEWLRARGLKLLESNYRCRYGELDIVMSEAGCLVVVEVRYRRRRLPVTPAETLTPEKCRRIGRAAMHYLSCRDTHLIHSVRCDVVAMSGALDNPRIEWIRHAFDFDEAP